MSARRTICSDACVVYVQDRDYLTTVYLLLAEEVESQRQEEGISDRKGEGKRSC